MRLIDADKLTYTIASNAYPVRDSFNSEDYGMFWTGGIEKAINEQPTVDAEKVIRCKDCKYHTVEDFAYGFCDLTHSSIQPDDFCSKAEQIEDEANMLDRFFGHPIEDITALLEDIKPKEKK